MKKSEMKSVRPISIRVDRQAVRGRTRASRRRGTCARILGSRLRARILSSADTLSIETLLPLAKAVSPAGQLLPNIPLLLVTRADGSKACLAARGRHALERDPSLRGRRKKLEEACRSLGAHLEIWTEDEIDQDLSVAQVVRPASAAERAAWAKVTPLKRGEGAAYAEAFAFKFGIVDLRPIGNGLVGIQRLTGIALALLCDLHFDPETRMVVWRPRACSVTS
jgi:hypothetical protein